MREYPRCCSQSSQLTNTPLTDRHDLVELVLSTMPCTCMALTAMALSALLMLEKLHPSRFKLPKVSVPVRDDAT